MANREFTKAQSEPVLTATGEKWCQNCLVCNKQINFLKSTPGVEYLTVGQYVRHKRCYPN
jgi:hypothetical protein